MLQKLIHFLKYNNATIVILAIILVLGGGALAAGPEAVGQRQTTVEGLDNTALLAADLTNFKMDFKIEKIEEDEKYYYVTYSFMDLVLENQAWQYQLSERARKISKKIKEDLGEYLAKFLAKHYEARLRELKKARDLAESQGEQKRAQVTEYSGLVGQTLNLAAKVFPGYEPVKKRELPTPEFNLTLQGAREFNPPNPPLQGGQNTGADNLTRIYNDYLAAHPEIFFASSTETIAIDSDLAGLSASLASTTPDSASSAPSDSAGSPQADSAIDLASSTAEADNPPNPLYQGGTAQDGTNAPLPEPIGVDIIELPIAGPEPAPAPEAEAEPAPTQSEIAPAE